MKPPNEGKPAVMRPMPMPMPEEMERGMEQAGIGKNFAYHAPIEPPKSHPRMDRPRGGHGPHN